MLKTNHDGAKWIEITKALLFWIRPKRNKTRFIFWKAPGLKKFYGYKNFRFKIWKYDDKKRMSINNLRVFIRLPFIYWDKHNCGWEFGLPNYYLWWHQARTY
ncbi:MAG: hypothetical protein E6Z74_09840 [Clostridium perfringens]|nr:hypothetical protein DRB99_07420 [Clostridium butyricum]MDU5776213.1 hypothetical protein [Clostridium perfringens]